MRYMDLKSRKLQYTYILNEELNLFLHFLKHNLKIKGLTYIQNIMFYSFHSLSNLQLARCHIFLRRNPLDDSAFIHSFIQGQLFPTGSPESGVSVLN